MKSCCKIVQTMQTVCNDEQRTQTRVVRYVSLDFKLCGMWMCKHEQTMRTGVMRQVSLKIKVCGAGSVFDTVHRFSEVPCEVS